MNTESRITYLSITLLALSHSAYFRVIMQHEGFRSNELPRTVAHDPHTYLRVVSHFLGALL